MQFEQEQELTIKLRVSLQEPLTIHTPEYLCQPLAAMRRCIDEAKTKHDRVRVVIARGNHDDFSSQVLAACLALYYENDPRVEIEAHAARRTNAPVAGASETND